ncbi:MAG: hypothetical protein KA175_08165 [Flavobacteriales bacterium]|nr:hypothetical protein [Flavobacteriales bacterium]MBP6697578.1 hypothetical protein [Flavobacteriales bacterium]
MGNTLHPARTWAGALLKPRAPWSLLGCLLFLVLGLDGIDRTGRWRELTLLNWDSETYYHYLPATLLQHDLLRLAYVPALDSALHEGFVPNDFGIYTSEETGYRYMKYTYGTALFELPLFLVAHAYCHLPGVQDAANGYSGPYQHAVALSSLLFVLLGLLVLRRTLLRYYSDRATAIALLTLSLGTNLFLYAAVASGMSHPYLFFLAAAVVELTDRWHARPALRTALLLGGSIGLIALTRPVDALIVLIPLLWDLFPSERRRAKWAAIREHWRHLLYAAGCALLPMLPQMLYWKVTTGHWVFYSYKDEGFDFAHPHILEGLFGFRKGWFVYSPLVLLGFLGLHLQLRTPRTCGRALPLAIYFPIFWWVVFSWYQWWYGGGFGCRPLVGSLALLALPIAHLADALRRKHAVLCDLLIVLVGLGIWLNFFQQRQYALAIIHWEEMTAERYWEVFGVGSPEGLTPFP